MLNCITCSKALEEPICEMELNGSTTPRSGASKEAINNLTPKVKDLSLKLSGVYTQCRPFTTSTSVYLKGAPQRSLDSDDETPHCYSSGFGSSTSTPTTSSANRSKPATGTPIVFFVEADTGVFITLLSILKGKNHLKRVRFSKENFEQWLAQLWWIENYDKIVELYNVIPNNKIRNR